jgi:hypothetical protein
MKFVLAVLTIFVLQGCDSIGLGGSYPSIHTKKSSECGCDGVMYIINNPNQKAQKITIARVRQSGTEVKKRKDIFITVYPHVEKKLGCSEINLYISGRSKYCDTHQSFYVKKYKTIK